MSQANPEGADDDARLERQVNRLVNERGALFDKAAARNGLSNVDQQRLSAIERELDECFLERRRLRAARDARRFDDRRFTRRQLPPRTAP